MKNYELLDIFIICYFVAIPVIFLIVWNENVNQWIPKDQRQTFFEFIIDPSDNLTFFGNSLFIILKLGAIPSITIFQILKFIFIK